MCTGENPVFMRIAGDSQGRLPYRLTMHSAKTATINDRQERKIILKATSNGKGHERYQQMIVEWTSAVLTPIYEKRIPIEDVPQEKRALFEDIFYRYTELLDVYENLKLCEEFIKSAPPRRKNVEADKYLSYHISFYLYEIYTLKERLVSYAKVVERIQKKREPARYKKTVIPALIQLIEELLGGLIKTRGSHVHDRAFEDKDVRRVTTYAFVSRHDPKFAELAKEEYYWSKTKWLKRVTENREKIDKVLALYFDVLFSVLDPKHSMILEAAKTAV